MQNLENRSQSETSWYSIVAGHWRRAAECKEIKEAGMTANTQSPPQHGRDVTELVENYQRAHPEIVDAMRALGISQQAYQASMQALYGARITFTNSANRQEGSNA